MDATQIEGPEFSRHHSVVLRVGVSRDAESMFRGIADRFEAQVFRLDTGQEVRLQMTAHDDYSLLELGINGELDLVSPISTISLSGEAERSSDPEQRLLRVGEVAVFAVSPVLLAVSPARARLMGYPSKALSWSSCFHAAQEDEGFRWMHPHPRSVIGQFTLLLAREFALEQNAGGPSEERDDIVRKKIALLESRVSQYGPSDFDVARNAFSDGEWHVDAFVAQEHVIVSLFAQVELGAQPVLVYPEHLNVFMDHPLVMPSSDERRNEVDAAYKTFRDYVYSARAQAILMQYGFRAANSRARAYFSAPAVPSSLSQRLHLPALEVANTPDAAYLNRLKASLIFTKRLAAVYLLADISGSMDDQKIEGVREGLREFLEQCAPEDQVGLITFSNRSEVRVQRASKREMAAHFRDCVDQLEANGGTALLDAILLAQEQLQTPIDGDPMRAVVLLTDGAENSSKTSEDYLEQVVRSANRGKFPVAIFAVAFGEHAEVDFLRKVVSWTHGNVLVGTRSNIVEIYRMIAGFV